VGPASAAAILLAGWLIGATGIGGVLVVPALAQFEAMDVQRAIAASALAFAFPGLAALWWLRRGGSASGVHLGALVAGAVPGAVLGALLVHHMQARWLVAGLAALALASGIRGLRAKPVAAAAPEALPAAVAAALGFAVGIGSALTGTGGPVLLVPLLMLWRQPLVRTVAAAQAIQLPIALCASAAHWLSGSLDLVLACTLGVLLLAGSVAGQWCARRMQVHWLQQLVSVLLVATGCWFAWRAFR
jgi:uncharacterized membrane protein YfcA